MDDFFTVAEARAWSGFLTTHAKMSVRLEENLRRTSGISHAEYEVLLRLFLTDGGRLRIQELAANSILSHSGTSRLVDRLVGAGLAERVNAEEDKRGAYAVLTELGRESFVKAANQHTALVRELFLSHFSAGELKTMASYWSRVELD